MADTARIIKLAEELRNEISEITVEDVDDYGDLTYGHAIDLANLMSDFLKMWLDPELYGWELKQGLLKPR
jgi:hypothetical protein